MKIYFKILAILFIIAYILAWGILIGHKIAQPEISECKENLEICYGRGLKAGMFIERISN